ncbi:MAG TPA: glycosyltransferase [Vicinamibacterales bacterium]|nr:glycosyltransferase [Vicinamibacterales bacterium]
MRVVHVSAYFPPAFRYGGPPASVLGLCKGLQRAGVDVEVVTTTANGAEPLPASPPEGTEYDGIPVRYAASAFPRRFFGARLREPLADALDRADVCHIHGIWNVPEWWASHLARARNVPYVVSPRGMLQPAAVRRGEWRKAVAYRLIEERNLRGASLLHATSEQEADAIRDLHLDVPVAIVPNGVDLPSADATAGACRARLGIPGDAFVVLFLGRMHRIKRLDLLADAFTLARATHPSLHLVVAGPDEHDLLPALNTRLASHAANVHTPGAVSGGEKWALLKDADVMVQCSDSESFGLAVVESLAAGVPVIATRTCPWSEIEARGCGKWVDQNAAAIADAIRALAADAPLRRDMGARAAAFAREHYSWDRIAKTMTGIYSGVH